jgi:hypothetical protein
MFRWDIHWAGEEYYGSVSHRKLKIITAYCDRERLKYVINGNFSERSSDYRATFFKNNPPFISDKYFCTYCGRLIRKDKVTVDHLYPVGAAKRSVSLQRKLKRRGINNINDVKNLVPACKRCNSNKGKKMGVWIIRGRLGRHPWLWVIRHILRAVIIATVMYWLWTSGILQEIWAVFTGLK